MIFEWEQIFEFKSLTVVRITSRAKVFGGWIVQDVLDVFSRKISITSSMVFIPDINHEWKLEEE